MMLDHHSLELLKASLGAWDYLFHIVRALINVHNFEINLRGQKYLWGQRFLCM